MLLQGQTQAGHGALRTSKLASWAEDGCYSQRIAPSKLVDAQRSTKDTTFSFISPATKVNFFFSA